MNRDELLVGALVGLEDTQHGSGQQTAPTSATDILSAPVPSITPGLWEFDVIVNLSGTAETQLRNLNMRLGTTAIFSNIATVAGTTQQRFRRKVTTADITAGGGVANAALNFRPAANATAGAVYTVTVRATKVGG